MKDYCTFSPDFKHGGCCKDHDNDYKIQLPKFQSDLKLFNCTKNVSGIILALIFFVFVSTLGWYWYLKAKRAGGNRG